MCLDRDYAKRLQSNEIFFLIPNKVSEKETFPCFLLYFPYSLLRFYPIRYFFHFGERICQFLILKIEPFHFEKVFFFFINRIKI